MRFSLCLDRVAVGVVLLCLWLTPGIAAPACPPDGGNYPLFYHDPALFDGAIAKVSRFEASNIKLTGITVPHHLLADRLVALGFRAASAFDYKRVIILSPDHFRRADRLFATTTRDFDTVGGKAIVDRPAVSKLLQSGIDIEDSCLFGKEHGVQAMLPFIRHYWPQAQIVPIAMSIASKRADWDRLADALGPLLDDDTLVVESTDFSHYLPQPVARRFDQQTLNVLAAGDPDQIAALTQPDHADSVGALYVQTLLQKRRFGAEPLVIANETSDAFTEKPMQETTSYNVILFGDFSSGFNAPVYDDSRTYYFAGDTNFGRAMKLALLDPDAADRVRNDILDLTHGRPMIVNLEGVILPNVPDALDDLTLAMPRDLTLDWLKALNVKAVSLANNHANDLGETGLSETLDALKEAQVTAAAQGQLLELPGLDVVALTDLDSNGLIQTNLLNDELLDHLVRPDASKPVVAMVHWGREYVNAPTEREDALADAMRRRGVAAIIGGHSHVASGAPEALAGGDTLSIYSMGNFLFDQTAERSSGQLIELRVFRQGTVFARPIQIPNFFDFARQHPPASGGR